MPQSLTRERASAAVLAIVALGVALGVATFDGTRLPNDTAQYLSVADNLRAGRGISTSVIYYEEHYALRTVPAPQTVFPPGYPALIAAVAAAGMSTATAAFVVALASWAVSMWFLYSITLARDLRPAAALACAATFACLALPWFYAQERLSEPLFVALTLAGTRCLARERRVGSWSALAGACAAAAITVRYAGLFFAAAVALVFAFELVRRRARRTLAHALAFAAPVLAVTAVLFWRNHHLVGDIRGGNAYEAVKPLAKVLRTAAWSVAEVTGLAVRPGFTELAAVAALAIAAVVFARGGARLDGAALAAAARDRLVLVAASYSLVTLAALLLLERSTSIGLNGRMLVPLVPFVLLLAVEIARSLTFADRISRLLALAALTAAVLSYLVGQTGVARARWGRTPPSVEVARALAEPLGTGRTVGGWLRARAGADHPVLGNEPQLLGAVLGRPVVGLASREYTSRRWTAEAVRELARDYDVEYVVLMPRLLAAEPRRELAPIFVDLAAGRPPAWLDPVHASPAIRLYRVRRADTEEARRAA